MVKRSAINLFLTLLMFIFFFNISTAKEYGSNWETECYGEICQTTIYAYEKYWKGDNGWKEIDEGFFDCSENGRIKYCTKNYNFDVVADSNGTVSSFFNGDEFTVRLNNLLNRDLSFNPIIKENSLIYENIIPKVDLRYFYTSNLFKEEIVLKEPLRNIPDEDFKISFTKKGNAKFNIQNSIICDNRGYCEKIQHEIDDSDMSVTVPISFLNNPEVEYPIIIDPTIGLNDSSIYWNGYIHKILNLTTNISEYTRTNNPASGIFIGIAPAFTGTEAWNRGDIDWNISSIPDNSAVYNITLSIYPMTIVFPGSNITLNVTAMEDNSDYYGDNSTECYGNCHFYKDIENGSIYSSGSYAPNEVRDIALGNGALTDFENRLTSDIFSMGLVSSSGANPSIGSKDNTNSVKRPKLMVIYGVNGSNGNGAIEEGIMDSVLGNNSITSNQQIYLVNAYGQHFLGRFDKTTTLHNQTWALNYVLPGESFTLMPSLFRVLNVWENQSLSFNEITQQVGAFINATMY